MQVRHTEDFSWNYSINNCLSHSFTNKVIEEVIINWDENHTKVLKYWDKQV